MPRGIGEFELISLLVEGVEAARRERSASWGNQVVLGSGDDAAVTVPAGATATSVDGLIEGVHFRRDTAPLSSVGHKALAVALSDLAAMGAAAGEAYVYLGVPEDLDADDCVELGLGLARTAARHGVAVLGGDVTRAPSLTLAITVVGHASSAEEFVLRSGANPGDGLAVTGELGGAAAGLLLLEQPELGAGLPEQIAEALRGRALEPEPRLAAGRALSAAGATGMIDISDGLGGDASHLADASGVRLVVELEDLPLQDGVGQVASAAAADVHDLATTGGEDYELLVALPPNDLDGASEALGATEVALTPIGSVVEGAGVVLRAPDGTARESTGFDQLR